MTSERIAARLLTPSSSGPHRYFFKLYALDEGLTLESQRADKPALLAAMKGHVLAEAEWMGTYERRRGADVSSLPARIHRFCDVFRKSS